MFAVAVGLLTACSPEKEKGSLGVINITANELLSGATFKQYAQVTDEAGNVTGYTEAADGNYITYDIPNVPSVNIFTRDDEGAETNLMNTATSTFVHSGGGMFSLIPRRGANPTQTVYFRYTNVEGKSVEASHDFTVYVPSDIPYEVKLIASNDYGSKVWMWDTSITGAVWGNMGYCGGAGSDVGISGNGQWWGIDSSAEFNNQLQHSVTPGVNNGDGDLDAYMIFNDDGTCASYTKDGEVIRKGTYAIENYDASDATAWKVGDLKTDAILWPAIINSDGQIPSTCGWGTGAYEIVYLTADKMTLVYPSKDAAGNFGGWGEATFWHFASNSDLKGMIAGYDKGKDWTWDTSVTGAVWGNMGYCGGAGADVGISGNGQWWGIDSSAEFNNQLQHSVTPGTNNGDGDLDAYMTIGTDGMITSYSAAGSEIRSGIYDLTAVAGDDWRIADLTTDAILWPAIINSDGKIPSTCGWGTGAYEVVYLTGSKMTLVYPSKDAAGALGGWGEATFWHFKAKE